MAGGRPGDPRPNRFAKLVSAGSHALGSRRCAEDPRQRRAGRWRGLAMSAMVTISIAAEAYVAIKSMLPKGVRAEPRLDEGGGFARSTDGATRPGRELQRRHSAAGSRG
jgi:hypothetical protein